MIIKICELPPKTAVSWAKTFLDEAWEISEIESFVRFCERDCTDVRHVLGERGVATDGDEFRKIDQILYHVRDLAWHRKRKLLKIESINARVRERLRQ